MIVKSKQVTTSNLNMQIGAKVFDKALNNNNFDGQRNIQKFL